MKIQQLFLATALVVSASAFAQKDELKTLKKIYAIEKPSQKDLAEYKAAVAKAEPLVASSTESDKVYLDFYKAMTPIMEISVPENAKNVQLAESSVSAENLTRLATALNATLEFEKKSGKKVYTDDILETLQSLKPQALTYAISLGKQNKFKEASDVLHAIYLLDKKDADNLYYAASYAVNAQDYDTAMKYYNELVAMKYTGEKTNYFAKNKANDAEVTFPTKKERDDAVKQNLVYYAARDEQEPSKQAEIYGNMVKILISQKKKDEAKTVLTQALAANPNDAALKQLESEMVLDTKSYDEYKKVANMNDADAVYNLGVLAMQENKAAEAETHFNRTIEMKPEYTNAYVNLAALKLKGDKTLVEQMNKLGTSAADQKKYDALKAQRIALFKSTLPSLEKAYSLDPKNEGVIDNLISVYGYLEMKDKRAALKASAGR
ncbi:MAG: hypothetical protein EOO50_09105 [Flavobacterium sp.]|uniref:tetratricopeptide repeat protein n=1 Tax=Flavobacterium sp. TaxID=239 RepID=UPI0011FD5032|nr:tetratricopeptide repeat protein [Flavobacterium sp.]RZJ66671.1 MAG: hypothetical protein EOO50_09105 [Flavobacterium sp.]